MKELFINYLNNNKSNLFLQYKNDSNVGFIKKLSFASDNDSVELEIYKKEIQGDIVNLKCRYRHRDYRNGEYSDNLKIDISFKLSSDNISIVSEHDDSINFLISDETYLEESYNGKNRPKYFNERVTLSFSFLK